MKIIRSIIRHSLLILIIWIVLITISTPALFKLDEVTQYRAERLIPSGVESERASTELVKITNRTGEAAAYEIVLVTGINATDLELLNVDSELSVLIKPYVVEYNSLYKIVREVFSNVDKNLYDSTINTYNAINQTLFFLEFMHNNGSAIVDFVRNTHMFLIVICKYYDEFNATHVGNIAKHIYSNLSMIPTIYRFVSTLYNGTLFELNNSKVTLLYTYRATSNNYTYLLFNAIRIHYYLLYYTSAYQNGLNKSIIESVINYTKLSNYPVDETLVNKTYQFITERGVENIGINELNQFVSNIVEEYIRAQKELKRFLGESFLKEYNESVVNITHNRNWSLDYFFAKLNTSIVDGQVELLNNLIELNNTAFKTIYDELLREASKITVNYYRYPVDSRDFIEKYYRDEIDLYAATREVTKIRIYSLTRIKELSIVVDIVYRYNGTYTFNAIYELTYVMFNYLNITNLLNITMVSNSILPHYLNISRVQEVIALLLTNEIWSSSLSTDYIYRLIIGFPIVAFTVQFSNDTVFINNLIRSSDLINSIVNKTYVVGNYTIVLTTLKYIVSQVGFNTLSNTISSVILINNTLLNTTNLFLRVLDELINLPLNASMNDYIKLIIETAELSSFAANFTTNDLAELISRVIRGEKPIDVVLQYVEKQIPPGVDSTAYVKYLRESLLLNNPLILYNYLREQSLTILFNDLARRFTNIFISENYDAFIINIYPAGDKLSDKVSNAYRVLEIIREILLKHGFSPKYIGVIGDNVLGYEMTASTRRDMHRVQIVSIIAPVIIAFLLICGLLATVVPFIGIATSLAVSTGLIYLLATRDIVSVTSWSRILLVTTSFGLGMDYSSYIILRFKEKYPETRDKYEATYEAIKYALPAIIAASSTDIIGFAVMKLAWEFPLIASLGETVPIAILVVMLESLTLTPALLVLFGDKRWFWWPHDVNKQVRRIWKGFEITPRRAYFLLLFTIIITTIGLIGFSRFRGSHDYSVFIPQDTVSYSTYNEFQKYFPSGKFLPVNAVFILKENYSVYDNTVINDLKTVIEELKKNPGIASIYSFLEPGGRSPESYVRLDNKSFYIEIVLNIPPLSREGVDLVREIRNYLHSLKYPWISEVLVGGLPASSCEVEEMLNRVFWTRVFPTAFILMWICMTLSFNSLLIGVIALVSIITGYLFGVSTAVYVAEAYNQPVLWFLTLLTLPAVLGVGLDYNSFYVNRQRYELLKCSNSYKASTQAVRFVSQIVIGLGLIVTATYGSIATGSSWGLREIGIALSTSVLVTTILSSIMFVPAILAILGIRAWWPGLKRCSR